MYVSNNSNSGNDGNKENVNNNNNNSNNDSDKGYDWNYVLLKQAFKTSFFKKCWVNEVAVFKVFKSLLNLFKIDGAKNEMIFCPRLLYLKGISKNICDLALYVFLEGTKCSFSMELSLFL